MSTAMDTAPATAITTYHQCQEKAGGEPWSSPLILPGGSSHVNSTSVPFSAALTLTACSLEGVDKYSRWRQKMSENGDQSDGPWLLWQATLTA
ncbi:hypothetical protein EYF80_023120 [Liparis tanakae]|uniref:Uncharacterized protein n=1 Tax=Liparis tanakae TaxID=230148 RepID=A0A4Z2HL91_9TELE|nr:hypothetical protein EYF80_023120 [Liparis tanakae]